MMANPSNRAIRVKPTRSTKPVSASGHALARYEHHRRGQCAQCEEDATASRARRKATGKKVPRRHRYGHGRRQQLRSGYEAQGICTPPRAHAGFTSTSRADYSQPAPNMPPHTIGCTHVRVDAFDVPTRTEAAECHRHGLVNDHRPHDSNSRHTCQVSPIGTVGRHRRLNR
jgi:hypothetical protein